MLRLALSCLVLTLAWAACDAGAADLYRWIDPDGREAIGTVPPPGVEAVPYKPGKPASATPSAEPAAPAIPVDAAPAETSPGAPAAPVSARARQAAELEQRCQKLLDEMHAQKREIQKHGEAIEGLEDQLAKVQGSEVAFSRMDCMNDTPDTRTHDCSPQIFDRDAEVARLEEKIAKERANLDDLELAQRTALPPECER